MTKHVESAKPTVSPETAWDVLVDWVLAQQEANPGQIVIPSGTGTGLFVRVTKKHLPFGIAADLLEAGARKPLTDISVNKTVDGDNWTHCHDRRLKRLANWAEGIFAQRGGSKDEVATQMKEEFTLRLKNKGVNVDLPKYKDLGKGTVSQMVDACIKAGMPIDKDKVLADIRQAAIARLAERGEASKGLDLTNITF
jgi:hypothetical protein